MERRSRRCVSARAPHWRLHRRHDRPLCPHGAWPLVQGYARPALITRNRRHAPRVGRRTTNENGRMRPAPESFEAETLALMRKAHELAWARLLLTGVVAGHNLRRMQKLTAQHVIDLALRGE